MAANWSAGHAAEFINIGRNVVVASKSGPGYGPAEVSQPASTLCEIKKRYLCSAPMQYAYYGLVGQLTVVLHLPRDNLVASDSARDQWL